MLYNFDFNFPRLITILSGAFNEFSLNIGLYLITLLVFFLALKLFMDIPQILNPKPKDDKEDFFKRTFKPNGDGDKDKDNDANNLLNKLRRQNLVITADIAPRRLGSMSVYFPFISNTRLNSTDISLLNRLFMNNTHPDYVVRPGRMFGMRLYNRRPYTRDETYVKADDRLINAVQTRLLFNNI